ncbi:hypothetical protein [Streptomyces longwoodensis]|uniref:hypothetical protein n=1 Tax=Streptomyces longwoodensis TaxID=68231 RepID=UPI00340073F9
MSHDFTADDDPAAATVFLAAEAAVLAERVRVLRGQLAEVGARIQETAEKLYALPAAEGEEKRTAPVDSVRDSHGRRHRGLPDCSTRCRC